MTPPRPPLPRAMLRSIVAVLDARTDGFVALMRVAGLDRTRDFRGAVLDGVDFGTDDLSGFDFSGADLSGADLSRATGLHKIITDANTRLPTYARRKPPDFDLAAVQRMIQSGKVPSEAWRPFITELEFVGWRPLWRVSPLARLTALQRLALSNTQVSDVSPLSGLTALQSLDLRDTWVIDTTAVAHVKLLEVHWMSRAARGVP